MYNNVTLRNTFDYTRCAIIFYGDNGATQHIGISTNANGQWIVMRGSTQIAISAAILQVGAWAYVEAWVVIADSGGRCVVKINGDIVIDFTGNTKNGGTATTLDKVKISGISNFNTDQYWDDLYLCDATGPAPYNTFLGEHRIYSLAPTGAGSSTQWTPDSGSNYSRVNEVPYSAANYVQSATSGQRDTYTMADLPATVGSILAVQNNTIAKRTDAAAISIKPAIQSGASVYYGTAVALTANDATVRDLRTIDPNTSTAWTVGGVNALEGGFEVA
jgi:hypothetical protein